MEISLEPLSSNGLTPAISQSHSHQMPASQTFLRPGFKPASSFVKLAPKFLTSNRLLSGHADFLKAMLAVAGESVVLRGNEPLYHAGDVVEYIYFPETAVVTEFQLLADGSTLELALTGREGVVGLLPAWNDCRAPHWTQVLLAGTAFRIKSSSWRRLLAQTNELQPLLLSYLNTYFSQVAQRAICNHRHALQERFCTWLLLLQARRPDARLPLSQEQIARLLGVHRPSITGIAQSLREARVINYRRGEIVITNRQKLIQCACQCFAKIDRGEW